MPEMSYHTFFFINWTEIDKEGCIEPDKDEPQQMGDSSIEVNNLFVKFILTNLSAFSSHMHRQTQSIYIHCTFI